MNEKKKKKRKPCRSVRECWSARLEGSAEFLKNILYILVGGGGVSLIAIFCSFNDPKISVISVLWKDLQKDGNKSGEKTKTPDPELPSTTAATLDWLVSVVINPPVVGEVVHCGRLLLHAWDASTHTCGGAPADAEIQGPFAELSESSFCYSRRPK